MQVSIASTLLHQKLKLEFPCELFPFTYINFSVNTDKHAYLSSGAGKANRMYKLYQDQFVRWTMRSAHLYFPAELLNTTVTIIN